MSAPPVYAGISDNDLSAATHYLSEPTLPNYPEYASETVFGTVLLPKIYGKNLDQFEIATDGKIVLSVQDTESLYIDTADNGGTYRNLIFEASNQSLEFKPNDSNVTVKVGDHTWTSSNQYQVLATSNTLGYRTFDPFTFENDVTFNGDTFGITAEERVEIDTSNLYLNGTLQVTSNVEFDSNLLVKGTTTLNKTLSVGEATTLLTTLSVGDATTLNKTLSVGEATTLSSNLSVGDATTLSSTLSVTGATTLRSDLSVGGSITVSGDLDIFGNINSIATTSTDLLVEDSTITLNSTNTDNSISGADTLGLIIGGSNNLLTSTLPPALYFADKSLDQGQLNEMTEKKLTWNNNDGYEHLGIFQAANDADKIEKEPYWELLGSPLHLSQNVVDQNGNRAKITFAFRMNADEELEIVKIVKDRWGSKQYKRIARFGNSTIEGKVFDVTTVE